MIAVTTVRDEGAAQVAKEALEERGIEVELKSLGVNPYFGSVTMNEFEVRVPEEHLDEAREVLDQLAAATEQAMLAQAGVPPDAGEAGDAELPSEAERPRRVSWSIVIPLLLFPGAGLMYARQFPLGLVMFGVFLGSFILPAVGFRAGDLDFMKVFIGLKVVETVLAPIFVVRFNRRLVRQGNGHADS